MADKKEEEPEPVDPGVAELQAQLGKEKYDKLAVKAGEIRLMFKQRQVGRGTLYLANHIL